MKYAAVFNSAIGVRIGGAARGDQFPVMAATIEKPAHQVSTTIELRYRFQLILIQEALHQRAIDPLANARSQKMNKIATFPILRRFFPLMMLDCKT